MALLFDLWFLTILPLFQYSIIPLKLLAFPRSCEYPFSVFRCLTLFEIREDKTRRPDIEHTQNPISLFMGDGVLSFEGS